MLITYISWIISILETIVYLIIYNLISYGIYILRKKYRNKESLRIEEFSKIFFHKLSLLLSVLILLIWSFAYYQNNIKPAKIPVYTISNWDKIIIFQSMSHIWSQNFYDKVKKNIEKYKNQWFVLFFEWVKPWKQKNEEKFDEALWMNFDKDLYKNISKLYGIVHQENQDFFSIVNSLDFNVDLSIDEIMEIYENKIFSKQKTKKLKNNQIPKEEEKKGEKWKIMDVNKEVIKILAELNPKQLTILRYINKSIISFIVKNDKVATSLTKLQNTDLFDVILEDRNINLVNEIEKTKYDKIIITYWLMHFKWVLELLKEKDPNWKIIEIQYLDLMK